MRIQMRTTIANAHITAVSGSIVELPDKEAKALIEGGFAEVVKSKTQTQVEQKPQIVKTDFSKYSADEIKEFAKTAKLDPKITDIKTIVKKLQEINFKPEAK